MARVVNKLLILLLRIPYNSTLLLHLFCWAAVYSSNLNCIAMKTKPDAKKKLESDYTELINTDAFISDFEFMYRMLRINMALDIDTVVCPTPKQRR